MDELEAFAAVFNTKYPDSLSTHPTAEAAMRGYARWVEVSNDVRTDHGSDWLSPVGSVARADPPQAPKNVNVEPATPKSAALTSRAAGAEMTGKPQVALKLPEQAVAANPLDRWGCYDKAIPALESFGAAKQRYSATDRWGKSVAIYGRAHALSEVGRCDEARTAFNAYGTEDCDP